MSRPTLYRFFCAEPRRTVIRDLLQGSLQRRQRLFCGEYLEFIRRNSNVLDSLDTSERMLVNDYYSAAPAVAAGRSEDVLAEAASA